MTTFLTVTARDPIVCRDGRPFGAGSGRRMKSAAWPSPALFAGAIRTALGRAAGGDFPELIPDLKATAVAGPFPFAGGKLFLPPPADCIRMRDGSDLAARPVAGGTDLPSDLRPVCLPETAGGKPVWESDWWSADRLAAWLVEKPVTSTTENTLPAPDIDERTHLEIDPTTLGPKDGMLYVTQGAALDARKRKDAVLETALLARVSSTRFAELLKTFDRVHPFGGERRLVRSATNTSDATLWTCPTTVRDALAKVQPNGGIRLALATPAIFRDGWRAGWFATGTPPGGRTVKLKLVGVSTERWKAVSGWSLETHGPKPIRRTVPAGGVYFFELVGGNPAELADLWLAPVSDAEQDRHDGFGLATWGVWTPLPE